MRGSFLRSPGFFSSSGRRRPRRPPCGTSPRSSHAMPGPRIASTAAAARSRPEASAEAERASRLARRRPTPRVQAPGRRRAARRAASRGRPSCARARRRRCPRCRAALRARARDSASRPRQRAAGHRLSSSSSAPASPASGRGGTRSASAGSSAVSIHRPAPPRYSPSADTGRAHSDSSSEADEAASSVRAVRARSRSETRSETSRAPPSARSRLSMRARRSACRTAAAYTRGSRTPIRSSVERSAPYREKPRERDEDVRQRRARGVAERALGEEHRSMRFRRTATDWSVSDRNWSSHGCVEMAVTVPDRRARRPGRKGSRRRPAPCARAGPTRPQWPARRIDSGSWPACAGRRRDCA